MESISELAKEEARLSAFLETIQDDIHRIDDERRQLDKALRARLAERKDVLRDYSVARARKLLAERKEALLKAIADSPKDKEKIEILAESALAARAPGIIAARSTLDLEGRAWKQIYPKPGLFAAFGPGTAPPADAEAVDVTMLIGRRPYGDVCVHVR